MVWHKDIIKDNVTHSDNTNNITQINYPQADVDTFEENIVKKYEVKWISWSHQSKLKSKTLSRVR